MGDFKTVEIACKRKRAKNYTGQKLPCIQNVCSDIYIEMILLPKLFIPNTKYPKFLKISKIENSIET